MNNEQNQTIMNNEQNQITTNNTTLQYAGFGSRLGAMLLDDLVLCGIAAVIFFIVTILNVVLNFSTGQQTTGILKNILSIIQWCVPILIIYLGMPLYRGLNDPKGKTIGRKVTKTILVKEDGSEVSVGISFLRQILKSLLSGVSCGITFIVDFILVISDKKNQTLADKILKTVVVYK